MKCKICKIVLWSLAGALAAAVAVWGSGWLWSLRDPAPAAALPGSAELNPIRAEAPGRPVTAELELKLPLWLRVVRAAAEPGEGTVLSGQPEVKSSWRWSHRLWRIAVTLRPLRSGETAPGNLAVELSRPAGGAEDTAFAAEIPSFRVDSPAAAEQNELLLAAAETAPGTPKWMYWQLLLLIPVALLIWFFLRRRSRAAARRAPEPWERALAELAALRTAVAAGKLTAEAGVARLTDIVRGYLEDRFHLPASSRTTPEFLHDLEHEDSPLGAEDRIFLREFLTGADLVKFARAPSDTAAFENAAGKAGALVEHTTPREEAENTENHEAAS